MVNEIKKSKIESLVVELNKLHEARTGIGRNYLYETELLRLVFNYEELNEYGKIIIEKAKFESPSSHNLRSNIKLDDSFEKTHKRRVLIEEWVNYCNGTNVYTERRKEKFYFILFSLMVVSVDKTNKEEKLSIICDFARMLKVTDEEIKDIVEILKIILDKNEDDVLSRNHPSVIYGTKEFDVLKENRLKALKDKIKSKKIYEAFESFFDDYFRLSISTITDYIEDGYIDKTYYGE